MKRALVCCLLALGALAVAADDIPHRTVVPDHVYATHDKLWEFATVVAPPGTTGCSAGRVLAMGSANLSSEVKPLLYSGPLLCSNPNCSGEGYQTKIKNAAEAGLVAGDFLKNDVAMARLRNGDLLIARVVRRELPERRFGMMIWASSDCGKTWKKRSFIDPSDTKWDSQGRYGKPKDNGKGGWDRQEIYADPFSDDVFITVNGSGGTGADAISNMLLFRSSDGGSSWNVTLLSKGQTAPVMMTSVPGGRLFFADHSGVMPRIRWSLDGGKTVSKTHDVFWSDASGPPKKGSANAFATRPVKEEGSIGISRISSFVDEANRRVNQVRVSYPSLVNGRQVLRIVAVTIREDDFIEVMHPPKQNIITITLPDHAGMATNLIQATVVQPDPTLINKLAKDNTALIYWRAVERPTALAGIGATRIEGILVRGEDKVSPVFPLSTDDSGAARTFFGGFFGNDLVTNDPAQDTNLKTYKTGDYSKGGFFFDGTTRELLYWVQWIETDIGGSKRTIHGTVIGVPRP
jgi:hypothetical protein